MAVAIVVGSGCAGLAASDALLRADVDVMVVDQNPYWGGHTHSLQSDGFTFDEGPHVSFTKDENVRAVFAAGAGEVHDFAARITNWFHGSFITHPAQCHLFGLDPELVTQCIVDFVSRPSSQVIHTYADWCRAMFGTTFAEHFPFAYTRKYWTVEAVDLSVDWVGARMYPPKLEEVVRGALQPRQEGDFHYLSSFRYPESGGYQSFLRSMAHEDRMHLNKRVTRIQPLERLVEFEDGSSRSYDSLISTMALPELVSSCLGHLAPGHVRAAADALLCSSLVLVDIAVNRSDLSSDHWFYVYDEDMVSVRGHFPHMLASSNAPPGMGAIQVEVYHSPHRALPCTPELLPERVVEEMVRLGYLAGKHEVIWARQREVPYANVIFDHHRKDALSVVLPWVAEQGIELAGRYGEWGYHWTDDATRSGWAAAARVLERLQVTGT